MRRTQGTPPGSAKPKLVTLSPPLRNCGSPLFAHRASACNKIHGDPQILCDTRCNCPSCQADDSKTSMTRSDKHCASYHSISLLIGSVKSPSCDWPSNKAPAHFAGIFILMSGLHGTLQCRWRKQTCGKADRHAKMGRLHVCTLIAISNAHDLKLVQVQIKKTHLAGGRDRKLGKAHRYARRLAQIGVKYRSEVGGRIQSCRMRPETLHFQTLHATSRGFKYFNSHPLTRGAISSCRSESVIP